MHISMRILFITSEPAACFYKLLINIIDSVSLLAARIAIAKQWKSDKKYFRGISMWEVVLAEKSTVRALKNSLITENSITFGHHYY